MKANLLLLNVIGCLLCSSLSPASALTVSLAPGVPLELSEVGSGDGAFLATARPVSKRQFQAFVTETNYRTESEKGTSGGFGYDPATKKVEQHAGYSWKNPGFEQPPDDPVVGVTRDDATAFLAWASRKTGRRLTLPSVSRWEMIAAAFPLPRPTGPGTTVREWTSDMAVQDPGQPPRAVLRGASWLQDANKPDLTVLSNNASPGSRRPDFGFRAISEVKGAPPSAPASTATPPAGVQPARVQANTPAPFAGNTPPPESTSVNVPSSEDAVPSSPARGGSGPLGVFGWIIVLFMIGLPLLIITALVMVVVKAFSGKAIHARTSSSSGSSRGSATFTNTGGGGDSGGGGSSQVSASTVAGGIQVRGNIAAGTPLRVAWADGPADGMTVPYQPGPQGMFIPVEGAVRNLRVTVAGADGIVPGATVVPVDGGFQVGAAVPDGTTIHAAWSDAGGGSQTGSARFDATSGHAFFRTRAQPVRIAVSLRPITGPGPSADPPPGARQISGGAYGTGQSRGMRTYQDDGNFWTGFWVSDLLSGPSRTTSSRPQNLPGDALFDDQTHPRPGSGRYEPPAYH